MAGLIKKRINDNKKNSTGNIVLQKRINFVAWKIMDFNGRFLSKPTEKLQSINQ